ncbi:hypothetical protein [Gordonia sp. (in: high G+C Gram-positive bacteria)]|uniref:hypothetical protein n=1 Tax=Gordonia sp. (in: high G+C Gram-positive bacteria) TaxID=84139 RepID=UPI0039E6D1E0
MTADSPARKISPQPPQWAAIATLMLDQDDVISRRQARELGCTDSHLRSKLRRREWSPIHPGIYVGHTGPLTWRQRAWAAVLDAYPAALGGITVLNMGSGPIHVVVDADRSLHQRKVHPRRGHTLQRRTRLHESVLWNQSPPRLRPEEAALDVANAADSERTAIATLSSIVGRKKTTVDRLLSAMEKRPRMHRRPFLRSILTDIRDGTHSVLEHRYLTHVERAHGLPCPTRQARTTAGRHGYRDGVYDDYGLVVELDGESFHGDAASRDLDRERDLECGARRRSVHHPTGVLPGVRQCLRHRGKSGSAPDGPRMDRMPARLSVVSARRSTAPRSTTPRPPDR